MLNRTPARHTPTILATLCLLVLASSLVAQGSRTRFSDQQRPGDELLSRGKIEADAYYQIGVESLREPSNSDRAVEHLEKAVELDEANAEYHYQLAEAYLANFEYAGLFQKPFIAPKVKSHLELAVRYDPSSIRYREALIRYYIFAPGIFGGSYEKAREQANEIARRDPYLGLLAHAEIHAGEGEGQKSLELFKRAIRTRPKAWEAYHRLGMHSLENREPDDAIEWFKKYIEVAPDQANSFNCLGLAYEQKRMHGEAIAAFQKALERDPTLAPLVFRIAQLSEFRGTKNQALEHYQRYLSMVPRGRAADDAREKIRLLTR